MPAILAFLGSAFAKIFTDKVISWIAWKALLIFLFTIIVPIVLNNFLYDIIKIIMDFAGVQSAGATFDGAMSFSGLMAWFIECFKLAECLSVLVSALVLRVILSMVPFVRLVG
jgi:hypothetical protein